MSENTKTVSDTEIDALEGLIPGKAKEATLSAYLRALSMTKVGVLRADAGDLVRVASDGTKTVVGKARPKRRVRVGEMIIVRRVDVR